MMRRFPMYVCASLGALLVAGAANASAATPFTQAWGYGVSTGAAQLETCTTSCQAGLLGPGDAGALRYPKGVAASPATGNLFVTNEFNRVEVYSPGGAFLRAFGGGVAGGSGLQVCTASCSWGSSGTGDGELNVPSGIAVDAAGHVVVGESVNDRVSVFTEAGAFVRTFGTGLLDAPRGLALDGSGNVFVVDAANNRVVEFTLAGAPVRSFGTGGSGAGQFQTPDGIGIGPSGNVIVSDTRNHRVVEFSPTGSFARAFGYGVRTGAAALEVCTSSCRAGLNGAAAGQLNYPAGLAIDANGRVLVSDNLNGRVNEYTETGTFLGSVGSLGTGAGQLAGAAGLGVDGAGNLFAADIYNHRVDMFDGRFPTVAPDQPSLSFGARTIGTTSSSTTVTLTNGGNASLSLSGISITGADAGQFSRPAGAAGGTCGTSTPVAPGSTCTVKVVFAPTTSGVKSAALAVAGNTLIGIDSVTLTGTGQNPVVSFDQTSLDLGTQAQRFTSAPSTVTVTNTGDAPLSLSAIAITGPGAAHFTRSGGTCDTAAPVSPGGSCTIAVVFTPTSAGPKSAALALSTNTTAGVASLPLSGVGGPSDLTADRSELAFGEQTAFTVGAVQTLTVTNTSGAPFLLTTFEVTGADARDFPGASDGVDNICTIYILQPGDTCVIRLRFAPMTAGPKSALLTIGLGTSAIVVPLSGTSLDASGDEPAGTPTGPPLGGRPQQTPTGPPPAGTPQPKLTAAGAPAVTARGTQFSVDPGTVVTCPVGLKVCTSVVTATASMPVPGHKGRTKKVVVGRASLTTREGGATHLRFVLTKQGASVLRKLGRLRLSVATVTTGGNGLRGAASTTFTVKRPRTGKR